MKTITKIVIALATVAALAVAAFLFWFYVIKKDAPPAFDDAALVTAIGTAPGDPLSDASGTWSITDGTEVGYRVKEVLSGLDAVAAGRTTSVTGSLTIDGTSATGAEFTVDMATFSSDDRRRDGQFSGPIMSVSEFPTSTFTLTSPIDFGSIPDDGTVIEQTATGDLTLHGVTRSVTFTLHAASVNGRIGARGEIPVVFADYDIDNPSNGIAKTEDNGLLEFILVFARA